MGLAWDMTPSNSYVKHYYYDGCAGKASLTLETWGPPSRSFQIEVERSGSPTVCLLGPTAAGFVPICEESFGGQARVVVVVDHGVVVRDVVVDMVALEFGGGYICSDTGKCSSSSSSSSIYM